MTIHNDINQFLLEFNSIDIKDRKNFVDQHKNLIESIRWLEFLHLIFNTITETDDIIQLLSFIKEENKLSVDILNFIYSFNSRAEYKKNQIIVNYYINQINEQVLIDNMSSDLIFNCFFYLYNKYEPCDDQFMINFESFLEKQTMDDKTCHYGIFSSINDAIFLDYLNIDKINKVINILLKNGLVPYNYSDVSMLINHFDINEPYNAVLSNLKMLYNNNDQDLSIIYQQLLSNNQCDIKDLTFQ